MHAVLYMQHVKKKWWKYLLWFLVVLVVVNAYICMKESPNHKLTINSGSEVTRTQLSFQMELCKRLIVTFQGFWKRRTKSNVDSEGRAAHWPVKHTKLGECRQCTAEKRRHEVNIQCIQCQVFLCIDNGCFEKYHFKICEFVLKM